ncbi:MAG: hypothetical protein PHV95_00590 [Eubacteriales bacterium]|nr:hypothetical protein [Eubacteriales bacterium]
MKTLKNKRGEGYIFPCLMIVVVCMILSVLIFFASGVSLVRITEKNSKIVLDSYVMQNSIQIYNSIKQGNDYTETLDRNDYIVALCDFCSLVKIGSYLYAYNDDGSLKYRMTLPVITFREENTLKIQLSYTLYVPIWFDGRIARYAVISVTVQSSFKEKF